MFPINGAMGGQQLAVLSEGEIASRLQAGSAAVMPTDTLPALVALPGHAAQIWRLKQRPAEKPLILMASAPEPLVQLAAIEARADLARLAQQHWPGALTLVVPVAPDPPAQAILQSLHPGASTLGLRLPACGQARDLMAQTGPLATTSANPSGCPAALNPTQAQTYFPDLPLLGPVPWPSPQAQASTVVAWVAPGQWRILREGAVMPVGVVTQTPCSG